VSAVDGPSPPDLGLRKFMSIDWQTLWLTLQLALTVSLILLILGLPIAYWIAFSRWRWKFLVEALVALPIVLPPTVLGFYVLIALGPHSPLGRWWISLTGHTLAFTFAGLVIGSIFYSLPFAVQPLAASFSSVDSRLLAASETLGASRLRTFLQVITPLSVPGLITGTALSFAHTMGEFGVVLMVGGNIPGITRTVSIDIYDRVQSSDYAGANLTALVLLAVCFGLLAVVYGMNRKAWVVPPVK
jgi:molybdate transport system permease protein